MKQRKNKIFLAICAIGLVLSILAGSFGCVNNQTDGDDVNLGDDIPSMTTDTYEYGTHRFKVTETTKNFIKDGVCAYTIVYPSLPTQYETTAVEEFNEIFSMATNLTLPTQRDGGLSHNSSAKYISIGNTSLLESSGIDKELDDLGRDGCKVVTKDNIVYIFGGEEGVIYGVYDYMSKTFNYEYYYEDCIEIDTNVTNLTLKNYNIKDVPDLENRWKGWGALARKDTKESEIMPTRLRMRYERAPNMLPIYTKAGDTSTSSGGTHNSSECLPAADYKAEHPNWYSNRGGDQLCFSAGCKPQEFANGNIPTEFEAMAQAISYKIQASLTIYPTADYPQYNAFCLGIEDNSSLCSCDACSEYYRLYGADSAPAIVLMNRVAEITDEWMEQEGNEAYKREMNYLFLAYLTFEAAPVKYNDQAQKYEPIDELVTPHENVGVYLATINSFENQLSIYDEINEEGRTAIDAWTDITEQVYLWMYQVNYNCAFMPYQSFNFYNDAYRWVVEQGIKGLIIQGMQGDNHRAHSAWGNLKIYLESKMLWNVNLKAEDLIDDWFNAMFKEGASDMKQMFDEMRVWHSYVLEKNNLYQTRSYYVELAKTEYWTLPSLRSWMSLCDTALEKVEQYKTTDPATYDAIKTHIDLEWASPAYILLKLYSKDLTSADKTEIIERFSSVVDNRIILLAESKNSVADFIAEVSK